MSPTGKRLVLLGLAVMVGLVVVGSSVGRGGLPPASPSAAATVAPEAQSTVGPVGLPRQVEQAQQRLAADPRDAGALAELAQYMYEAKRYAQAADLLYQALEIEPDNARFRLGLGMALFYQGMPTMAIRELRRAIQLDPDNPVAHYNYGLAISHGPQADLEEARASWQTVVRLDPDGELGRRARELLGQ